MILAAASINDPSYVPTDYQTFLLTVFIMILHAILSSMPTRWLCRQVCKRVAHDGPPAAARNHPPSTKP